MNTTTTATAATLSTTLHTYSFDIRTPEGREAWRLFTLERQSDGARVMGPVFHDAAASRADRGRDGSTVTLETAHLFDNQWNATDATGAGFRAFDWLIEAEAPRDSSVIGAPKGIKRGYYLDQTPEMHAARSEREACGYCGKQRVAAPDAPTFCPACIGSEYLKPEDFRLTRMAPVMEGNEARAPLSDDEQSERLAAWREAQREGAATRAGAKLVAFRARVEAKALKEQTNAQRERDGMLWLLDHDLGGLAADNAIYYNHTGRFSFGWRAKLDYSVACDIMGKLSDEGFPFPYDVETVQRGKLSGAVEG